MLDFHERGGDVQSIPPLSPEERQRQGDDRTIPDWMREQETEQQ